MNVELAEHLMGILLAEPERLRMDTFLSHDDDDAPTAGEMRREWPCGTTACIAGHVAVLTAPADARVGDGIVYMADGRMEPMVTLAAEALELASDVAYTLFHHVTDSEAVMALKFLVGNPDADSLDLIEFIEGANG